MCFILYDHILKFLLDPYCSVLPPDKPCTLFIQDPLEGFSAHD